MFTKYLILSNIIVSPMLKHPMSLGSMMIFQTALMCSNNSMTIKSSWYLYIMFLTTVGGLMIMFMYMSSIASNEKFKPSKKIFLMWTLVMLTSIVISNMDPATEMTTKLNEMKEMTTELTEEKSTSKFFSMYKMNITITMMFILIITMISVNNIVSTFEGPLKKTYV
uniref:NADH dehydrogenase subunit 6 n=1 Tax=Lycorma delicatula TaxID=130591 RepID=A0A7U3QIY7_LYCDL|nr:NADH dehydrogenase subunit 6 [Lycorma delicatula]QPN49486.1 NADH dehydrogenase subunit 6 [Lycorma delicatula]QPN49499.1 NADH dehydrogenase subunit 6 [Lycorma delicatula]QPN49512.1 NADH dehydrogenase subunit 6 [Lycorma delicatula]QPN49525.1 NADH dehydrogenase subunit 6 [Lycorma delicatula]